MAQIIVLNGHQRGIFAGRRQIFSVHPHELRSILQTAAIRLMRCVNDAAARFAIFACSSRPAFLINLLIDDFAHLRFSLLRSRSATTPQLSPSHSLPRGRDWCRPRCNRRRPRGHHWPRLPLPSPIHIRIKIQIHPNRKHCPTENEVEHKNGNRDTVDGIKAQSVCCSQE